MQRAIGLTEALRIPQSKAIFNVLSEAMMAWLKEASVNMSHVLESPYVKAWREELEARGEALGKALGEANALLRVLASRKLDVDDAT